MHAQKDDAGRDFQSTKPTYRLDVKVGLLLGKAQNILWPGEVGGSESSECFVPTEDC